MQESNVLYISNVFKMQMYSSVYIYSIFNTLLENSSSRILQLQLFCINQPPSISSALTGAENSINKGKRR